MTLARDRRGSLLVHCLLYRDFPNRFAPTSTVDLLDDRIAAREIDKLFPDASKHALARHRAAMLSKTACIRVSVADPSRPSPLRLRAPAISPWLSGRGTDLCHVGRGSATGFFRRAGTTHGS